MNLYAFYKIILHRKIYKLYNIFELTTFSEVIWMCLLSMYCCGRWFWADDEDGEEAHPTAAAAAKDEETPHARWWGNFTVLSVLGKAIVRLNGAGATKWRLTLLSCVTWCQRAALWPASQTSWLSYVWLCPIWKPWEVTVRHMTSSQHTKHRT